MGENVQGGRRKWDRDSQDKNGCGNWNKKGNENKNGNGNKNEKG